MRSASWVAGFVSGDLGVSYTYRVPVAELILERLAITVPLAVSWRSPCRRRSPCRSASSPHRATRRPADAGVMGFSQVGVAVPNFWFALLLVLLFSITLGWSPAGGFPGWSNGFWPPPAR